MSQIWSSRGTRKNGAGRNGKRAAGSEVQNKELWKLFLEYAEKQDLEMKYCRCSEYTGKLQAVIHGEEIEDV